MLCPEVWDFKAPASHHKIEIREFDETDCLEKINSFHHNHLVSVVLPDTLRVPQTVTEILSQDSEYYKVSRFAPVEFTNKIFIENFVDKGNLTALSINTRIDCEDCFSITPQKILILSLTKQTYQNLGLEGKVSQFCHNTKYKYIVKLNLSLANLRPGSKYHNKVKSSLEKLRNVDLILNWEPPNEDVCPSSVAKYFHNLKYEVTLCEPKYKTRTEYNVKVPTVNFKECDLTDCVDIIEWIGMFSLQCDVETGAPDNFLTTYETITPNELYGQVKYLEWRGFFSSKQIWKLICELRNYIDVEKKPWMSLYVQGFSDAPTNWPNREHHYYTNGDDSYVILANTQHYMFCKQACSLKRYKK